MSDAVVAKRYADALFQLGEEKKTMESMLEELNTVQEVFRNNHQLNSFLVHPGIDNGKKKQFVHDVFQGLSNDVVNLLKILIERHRVNLILPIIEKYNKIVSDSKGIVEARVYSVRKLKDSERKELENMLVKRFDKKAIRLENIVDPSIIGGVKIRMGNTIIDGSISGKLKRMERKLATANQ